MRSKRLLFVLLAVVAAGIGFAPRSEAVVPSPVATILVPCNADMPSSSVTTAPSGTYRAIVIGACNWAGARSWGISPTIPCVSPAPCVTAGVTNITGETCGTTTGLVRVEACGAPVSTTSDCLLQVEVDGECLTVRGTTGLFDHDHNGAFTAIFVDNGHHDNSGAFLVVIEPI